MKKLNINQGSLKKIAVASLVFISRFGVLPANISPLGSFGFFSQNIFLYFATIFIFDFVKGGFYQGFLFTYLGFFIYWLFGRVAKTQKLKFLLLPVASFSFFLISNLGVWLAWYPRTAIGLTSCYSLALPFYRNTLVGDLMFGYSYLLISSFIKNFRYKYNLTVN